MTWDGENRSGRLTAWQTGNLVRYGDGPTALMRVDFVEQSLDPRGVLWAAWYYGRQFFGGAVGAYHGLCTEPSVEDVQAWLRCHSTKDDAWLPGTNPLTNFKPD